VSTFADDLKEWRSRMGFLQPHAAAWLGIPYRTYQEWEQGRSEPSQLGPVRKLLELSLSSGRRPANQSKPATR
jgi:DNA-binding transcriptional regulator YiaG